MTKVTRSLTETLEKLIRDRAETLPDVGLTLFPEALVDLLDEKNNEIAKLRQEILDNLKKSIELSGGDFTGLTL